MSREELYDALCFTLTHYEQQTEAEYTFEEIFDMIQKNEETKCLTRKLKPTYEGLVEIQNRWCRHRFTDKRERLWVKKIKMNQLFCRIVGQRFSSYQQMEDWFRKEAKKKLPALVIRSCDGINEEIEEGLTVVDYAADGSFGEKMFGMDYADFTITYILDNAKRMHVTGAWWN